MTLPETENAEMMFLTGTLMVALVPHMPSLPAWINIWCVFAYGYLMLAFRNQWPMPTRRFRLALTGIGLAGVFFSSGHQINSATYQSLLAITATLKPMEIQSHRDKMVTLFFSYFIIITSLFLSESLLTSIYMFFSVFVTTAALVRINHPGSSLRSNFSLSGRILLLAFPLMAVLFLLFPRIEGTLWGITPGTTAHSGFSNTLSPGSVSRLILSSEVAFRATFSGPIPTAQKLYWRGLVFPVFNGRSWETGPQPPLRSTPLPGADKLSYQIRLEAHNRNWLFALDLPSSVQQNQMILADHTLRSWRRIGAPIQYQATSLLQYATGPIHPWEKSARLLPKSGNTMARELAAKWKQETSRPEDILERALSFFADNPFSYTLKPPLLGQNVIDDFLFRSRQGYCEHYASALAFLMRAAGVPARVVAGYLGGDPNPYGDFLIIRQYHAHAWTEVWLDSRGWVRIDPTSLIAPDRIELGPAGGLPAEDLPDSLLARDIAKLNSLRNQLVFFWEAVNNQWDMWFSGYSHLEQQSFFKWLGLNLESSWKRIAVLLSVLMALVAGFLLFLIRRFNKAGAGSDRVQEQYEKFCRKLRRIGIIRDPSLGPADFARFIAGQKPSLAKQTDAILSLYIRLRYAGEEGPEAMKDFQEMVRRFDPVPEK